VIKDEWEVSNSFQVLSLIKIIELSESAPILKVRELQHNSIAEIVEQHHQKIRPLPAKEFQLPW